MSMENFYIVRLFVFTFTNFPFVFIYVLRLVYVLHRNFWLTACDKFVFFKCGLNPLLLTSTYRNMG